ncbi:MAG: hypothetical protein ACYCVD_06420 [Desulfitobacteriaceae bacterium]
MRRMKIQLDPVSDWQQEALEDWRCALGAFLIETGQRVRDGLRLPGYEVLEIIGNDNTAELILSASERLVFLEGLIIEGYMEKEFARFIIRFAREMGARGLFVPVDSLPEECFWQEFGGKLQPEPQPLGGTIKRSQVGVGRLDRLSLLVTYTSQPVLCLEPIACNVHSPGPISLAQYRLEKVFGGGPLGFASRVAAYCPWDIRRSQWDDLLSYSRLQAFELLEDVVNEGKIN